MSDGEGATCRLCGTSDDLTKHHLLKRRSAAAVGRNATVVVCRRCHDRFHAGDSGPRHMAWAELYSVLTPDERALRDDPRRVSEWWEAVSSSAPAEQVPPGAVLRGDSADA